MKTIFLESPNAKVNFCPVFIILFVSYKNMHLHKHSLSTYKNVSVNIYILVTERVNVDVSVSINANNYVLELCSLVSSLISIKQLLIERKQYQ